MGVLSQYEILPLEIFSHFRRNSLFPSKKQPTSNTCKAFLLTVDDPKPPELMVYLSLAVFRNIHFVGRISTGGDGWKNWEKMKQ